MATKWTTTKGGQNASPKFKVSRKSSKTKSTTQVKPRKKAKTKKPNVRFGTMGSSKKALSRKAKLLKGG